MARFLVAARPDQRVGRATLGRVVEGCRFGFGGDDLSAEAPDKMPGVGENPRHRFRVGFVGEERGFEGGRSVEWGTGCSGRFFDFGVAWI